MSSQEQNDRHIIWSDISLDLDDWRESLEELYPGYSDDELYDIMVKSNAENLYDERVNLNIQLSQPIIVIGDLGRWNGRVSGYKMIDSGNIKDCLYSDTDYNEWYVDILNRITQNRAKGKQTFIFIDEIYLLFQHEYSANFLFTLWKRVRKYGAYATGITQNVDDLLQSHTARTMLANSEFLIMLNQASTDRIELAKLLNISDLQLSYITNVDAGHGLIKVGSSLVPFANKFPKNTKLYKLMTTKPGEGA